MKVITDFIIGFKEGVLEFGLSLNAFVNSFFLTIVYVMGVGLTSVFAKILGKQFLDTRIDQKSVSYWTENPQNEITIDDCFRQF